MRQVVHRLDAALEIGRIGFAAQGLRARFVAIGEKAETRLRIGIQSPAGEDIGSAITSAWL